MPVTFTDPDPTRPHHRRVLPSPVGDLLVTTDGRAVVEIWLGYEGPPPEPTADPVLDEACRQLTEYFAGARQEFDLVVAPAGSAFQRRVWAELTTVPHGATASYGQIAAALDMPTASRAVGAANGRNPVPVVVPCHRIVGADGRLTGYSGGLDRKQTLLLLEYADDGPGRSGGGRRPGAGSDLPGAPPVVPSS